MNRFTKLILAGLASTVMAAPAWSGAAKNSRGGTRVMTLELPPLPEEFGAMHHRDVVHRVRHVALSPAVPTLGAGGVNVGLNRYVKVCGGVSTMLAASWPEYALAMRDPEAMQVFADAYRKCRAIKGWMLDPGVRVGDYPEGYFGDYVHENRLVLSRAKIVEEGELGQVFRLLAELVNESQEMPDWGAVEWEGSVSFADFRRNYGFQAALALEFVGEVPLRVELDEEHGWVVVKTGDKWAIFGLDRGSGAALRERVEAAGRGRANPEPDA